MRWQYAIVVGILIGAIAVFSFTTLTRSQPPSGHQEIINATSIYYEWDTTPVVQKFLSPSLISSRTGSVGTPLNVIDLRNIVLRNQLYTSNLPDSIWEWSLNGTAAAVMRIIGPFNSTSWGNIWYVEISRLTLAKLTIYLPNSASEIMEVPYGAATPVIGYTEHFYNLTSTGLFNEVVV